MVNFTENKIIIELEKTSIDKLALDLKTSVAEVINQLDFDTSDGWNSIDSKIRFCLHLSYIFVDEKIAQQKREKKLSLARESIKKFNLANNRFYYSR